LHENFASEEYFFDLHGYTIIPNALGTDHIAAINAWIDELPPLKPGDPYGKMYAQAYGVVDGVNIQDIIEGGEIFERLIDHPAWFERVCHYIGKSGKPYINEIFLNVREPGAFIWPHSGGHAVTHIHRSGRYKDEWVCWMLSLLVPLTDIGPGDGATVIVPGSHKSDLPHPETANDIGQDFGSTENLEGAIEVHLKAGDALLFNDAVLHGSAARVNPGQRRMLATRYTENTVAHRFGYAPSLELAARLTPERLAIVQRYGETLSY